MTAIRIAYLCTEKPIIFWTDATVDGVVDFYPDFRNLCAAAIKNGTRMEQTALSMNPLAIDASDWGATIFNFPWFAKSS
jgi:hypothetical protein